MINTDVRALLLAAADPRDKMAYAPGTPREDEKNMIWQRTDLR